MFSLLFISEDAYILQTFQEKIEYFNTISTVIKKGCPNCKTQKRLIISSKQLCLDLAKHGCIPNKSHHTYFPDIPKSLFNHFIRGVFDGDGSVYKVNSNGPGFSIMGNKDLIVRIQEVLVAECELNKTKLSVSHRCKENIVQFSYGGRKNCIKFRDWLYKDATVYLHRKYNRFYAL